MVYLRLTVALILLAVAVAVTVALTVGFTGCADGFVQREGRVPYCGHPHTPPI